ncbi:MULTISPECIES: Scr1 family TA system antitoxin-like transcriptional regulator [Actinosynnema]|uniref:Scr1 family TA system antitoxin-like transcriptional regulator n=1 Tax=Actinosynnema TaxID=40566 RepID=UPI002646CE86|nr:Scr1 family TA system antitoxin-like transcriptional regulator [Actinosynnema pretiosum]MCP2095822.1 Helix-turn-helix domain-containing protein [Actinosynnema pretiosum]
MTQFEEFVQDEYTRGRTVRALTTLTGRSARSIRRVLEAKGVPMRGTGEQGGGVVVGFGEARARREELAALLHACRVQAQLPGRVAGERAGMSQSKVSKLENGRLVPKVDDVLRLVDGYRVAGEVRDRALRLAEQVAEEARHREAVLNRTESRAQAQVARAEQAAEVIKVYAATAVPDLPSDNAVLRTVQVVVPEGVARCPRQAARIRTADGGKVQFGVLPFGALETRAADTGFRALDDRMVVVELLSGSVVITDEEDVRAHVAYFDRMHDLAIVGRDMWELMGWNCA